MSSMTPPSSGPESNQPSDVTPQNGAESVDAWDEAELEDESLLENVVSKSLLSCRATGFKVFIQGLGFLFGV